MNPLSTITEIINQFGLIIGMLVGIGTYFLNKKKQGMEAVDYTVKNTQEIQKIYETSFKEFEIRYKAELVEKDKEHAEDLNRMRVSMEDESRQKRGELLVKITDLEARNMDLKVQVAQLGGVVQGVTGMRIYEWQPKKQDEIPAK